jgi:glucose/arabinose dehydrogenase
MYKRLHNGGAMIFGQESPKPMLYITTGDAGEREWAQQLSSVHGKVLRLNDDGTVPLDNPFTATNGYPNSYRCADHGGRVPAGAPADAVCGEVYAVGLRNPFRMALNPNIRDKTLFTVGDVGAQHMESIYYGGTDYKAANYGWPMFEGVCRPGDFNACPRMDTTLVEPFHWYQHVNTDSTGGAIAGQAFVPDGAWPEEYKYMFIDFIFLKIYSLEIQPERADYTSSPPYPGTRNVTFYRSIQDDGENVNEARMVRCDEWCF